MEKIIQSAATTSQPRRTELRWRQGWGGGGVERQEEEEERGLRPYSLGRARVAGAQISWGWAKINRLLWWKTEIKAVRPLIPSASLRECPYSTGTSGEDCVHYPWWECLNNSPAQAEGKQMSFLLWTEWTAWPLISFQTQSFLSNFSFPAALHCRHTTKALVGASAASLKSTSNCVNPSSCWSTGLTIRLSFFQLKPSCSAGSSGPVNWFLGSF